jgi:hypothetical protein
MTVLNSSRTHAFLKVSAGFAAALIGLGVTACSGGSRAGIQAIGGGTVSAPEVDAAQVEVALSTAEAIEKIKKLKKQFDAAQGNPTLQQSISKQIILTLRTESRKDSDVAQLGRVLDTLSLTDWRTVASANLLSDMPSLSLDLLRVYDRLDRDSGFTDLLSDPIINGDDAFMKKSIAQFGYSGVIEIFSYMNIKQLDQLSPTQLQSLLDRTVAIFTPEATLQNSTNQWTIAFNTLGKLRVLGRKLESELPTLKLLVWLENIHRKLQDDFAKYKDLSKPFITSLSNDSLDAAWFKFLFLGQQGMLATGVQLDSLKPVGTLDEILKLRLLTRVQTSTGATRLAMNALCEKLHAEEIPSVTMNLDTDTSADKLFVPGCHEVNYRRAGYRNLPVVTITGDRVLMSPDSVIFAPDTDFAITANYFEGTILDLSSVQTPPALPPMPTASADYDAVTFPIVLGFEIKNHPSFLPDGVYYMMAHDPFRAAKEGPFVDVSFETQPGYRGGKVTLTTKDASSIPPVLLSVGGPGQIPPDPAAGGKSSTSIFDPAFVAAATPELSTQVPGVHVLNQPLTISFVQQLLDSATQEGGSIKLFYADDYLLNLNPQDKGKLNDQGTKVVLACQQALMIKKLTAHPDLSACFKNLIAPQFIAQLKTDLSNHSDPASSGEVLPYLAVNASSSSAAFILPNGPLGKTIPVGPAGKDGSLNWNQAPAN